MPSDTPTPLAALRERYEKKAAASQENADFLRSVSPCSRFLHHIEETAAEFRAIASALADSMLIDAGAIAVPGWVGWDLDVREALRKGAKLKAEYDAMRAEYDAARLADKADSLWDSTDEDDNADPR